jgi:LuxR family maltose regulon positive regulatory protein
LDQLPQEDLHARARATDALGLAYELSGNLEKASQAFLRASELAQLAGVSYLMVNALCEGALVQVNQGKLHLASQTCRQAIQLGSDSDKSIPPVGLAWSILAEIAREQNDLSTAEKYLMDGIRLSRQGSLPDDLRCELMFLARLRQATGDFHAALAAIEQMDAITRAFGVQRLSILAGAQRARIHLIQGTPDWVYQWAATYEEFRKIGEIEYVQDFEELTLIRAYLANQEYEKASRCLLSLLEAAEIAGRNRTALETIILIALSYQAENKIALAIQWFEKALIRAEPEGFLRIFLDEGPSLKNLLSQVRQVTPSFTDRIIKALSSQVEDINQKKPQFSSEKSLDVLSEQELKVLNLIIAGHSNQEIAKALVISIGTAKWHVHNILQKMGVSTRSQAIARARELDI